jgi:hypothetical protein
MATYTVTFKQLLDNYAVLQTLTDTEIEVGQSITVASVASPFNGTFVVYALPKYEYLGIDTDGDLLFNSNVSIPNQVLFKCTGSDVDRTASATGTITYTQTCTWITAAQLETYLGAGTITNPSDDYTLLTQAVSAGNNFCWRRRQEAGYTGDALGTSPGGDCTLGVLMYAAALWRARGSVQDTFATFDGMGNAPVSAMTPMIKQLLGIDRPQVA